MSERARGALVLLVVLAVVGLGLAGRGSAESPDELCLTALDVGQGDALLMELPGGGRWLVDGGGDPSGRVDVGQMRLLPALRRRGLDRIDAVFATHGDLDHTGGLAAVLDELEVGELWISHRRSSGLRRLVGRAGELGVPVRVAVDGDLLEVDAPVSAALLHPHAGWQEALSLDAHENNASLVLHVSMGRVGFLLTGDVEGPAEELLVQRGLPRSAVLKVPHHGSRTSSTPPLLAAVDPLVALTGAGRANRFGFPHASVAARYARADVPLYWTGRHGEVRICTDGWRLRSEHRPPRGRWAPLRDWDAAEVEEWALRPRPTPVAASPRAESGGGIVEEDRPSPRRKRRRNKARRSRRRSRARATPTPEPTPPVLLGDREWERSRKARRRPRPPWKR